MSAEAAIKEQAESITKLSELSSKYPYYKYNGMWTRDVQNVISSILLCGWLGGMNVTQGKLFTIEEVGSILNGAYPHSAKL